MGAGRGVAARFGGTGKLFQDVTAFTANISCSVLIIFVNKQFMDPVNGCGFVFATTLCALHFFASAAFVKGLEVAGYSERAGMPLADTLMFAAVAAASISTMNLSLLMNNVGFYQIAKLLIIPCVCIIEFFWLGKRFTWAVIASILLVITGVAIVTVSEVAINTPGLVVAMVSVVTAGMQQVLCGHVQRKCSVTSNQLLSNTAPWQGLMLIMVGPFVDLQLAHKWVFDYVFDSWAKSLLVASTCIAVLVNITQFLCLGRFSAVTFTVLGHGKTMAVLIIGCVYLGEIMTARKLSGMLLAISGMLLYGWLQSGRPTAPVTTAATKGSSSGGSAAVSQPLLAAKDVETGIRTE